MSETYVVMIGWAVVIGALAWLGALAVRGIYGTGSPWGWRPKPLLSPSASEKLSAFRRVFDPIGLLVAGGMIGWHFLVAPLPEALLWRLAAPLAAFCATGLVITGFRSVRRRKDVAARRTSSR